MRGFRLALFKCVCMAVSTSAYAASVVTADLAATFFGVPMSVLLAAFAGAAGALSFQTPQVGRVRIFGGVVMSFLAGAYGTPLVSRYLDMHEPSVGVGFFLAMFAQPLLTAAHTELPAWIKRKSGGAA